MSVNVFEFLLVIVSIVLGLGITELLAGLVRTLLREHNDANGAWRMAPGHRAQLPYTVSTTASDWSYEPTRLPRPPSTGGSVLRLSTSMLPP